MGSTFNPQILVDKLSKLNSSQQSIETLSHWCIFHMNKAKQVVETWDRQFYCAPREQRLAFLYLANDILQNSRRKGAEFFAEFWKVLPDSLRDVIVNGDEFGKNAALRLISIWEERKVFGSRGQILKEEFVKGHLDSGNKSCKHEGFKLRSPGGSALDKLTSGYQAVYSSQLDENAIFNKCADAITFCEIADKDSEGDYRLDELKEQHGVLRECIEQLLVIESSRATLVSLLREALQEQEYKLGQVRDQLQAGQTHSERADGICRQLVNGNGNRQVHSECSRTGKLSSQMPLNFIPGAGDQSALPVMYTSQDSAQVEEDPKSAAAAMAAKLTASTSSAQMLTFVLSSLASSGVIGNPVQEHHSEKKAKVENDHHPSYVPQNTQAPASPFSDDGKQQHNTTVTSQVPSPSLPPLQPPMLQYPLPQYLQTAMPVLGGPPYGYGMSPPLQAPPYAAVGAPFVPVSEFGVPVNGKYPAAEGGFYGQPSSTPMAPRSDGKAPGAGEFCPWLCVLSCHWRVTSVGRKTMRTTVFDEPSIRRFFRS